MLRHLVVTFCLIYTTASKSVFDVDDSFIYVDGGYNELRWSESYTVKATRIALMSNIEEDFTVWKTNSTSRVDCNKGAYKVIARTKEDEDSGTTYTYKMIIRPETTATELNVIKCHVSSDYLFSKNHELDDILPRVDQDDYVVVDNETIEDRIQTTKFEFTDFDQEYKLDVVNTLWASYSEEIGWTPVKLDVKKYNKVLGSLIKHDIWTFFDYYPDVVNSEDVFDPYKNGCVKSQNIEHTADSEKVTKELYFIDPENDEHVDHVFKHFKNKFSREYKEENEHELRRAIFRENMRLITSVNRRNLTYQLGVNEFSDWTPEEKQMTVGIPPLPSDGVQDKATTIPFPYDEVVLKDALDDLPDEYDMRVFGYVSPVKNQERCGSCWTFAAAAVVESALARVNGGKVLGLSNQAILDCAYDDIGDRGSGGCSGGFDYTAYDFIERRGLPTDQEYGPYKMRDGFCHIDNMTTTYKIKGYTEVTKNSASAMKLAVFKHGPLFIYIHFSDEFRAYSNGIFYQSAKKCNPDRPNHAVVMVGYGEMDGEPFFILKNSYGVFWGNDGYALISARDNVCGVQSNPTYPVF